MLLSDVTRRAVGTVIKPHGIHGELNVAIESDDFPTTPGKPLIAEINGLDVPFFIASVRPRGAESVLLTLDEIKSDTDAAQLVGHTLYVYSSTLAADFGDEAELTADALVGYTITDGPDTVGVIDDIRELSPDNWCFVLAQSGKLIPIADEMIIDIDHDARIVEMNLPTGLLDL